MKRRTAREALRKEKQAAKDCQAFLKISVSANYVILFQSPLIFGRRSAQWLTLALSSFPLLATGAWSLRASLDVASRSCHQRKFNNVESAHPITHVTRSSKQGRKATGRDKKSGPPALFSRSSNVSAALTDCLIFITPRSSVILVTPD